MTQPSTEPVDHAPVFNKSTLKLIPIDSGISVDIKIVRGERSIPDILHVPLTGLVISYLFREETYTVQEIKRATFELKGKADIEIYIQPVTPKEL